MPARMSRFKIHDEESAPERSQPILKSAVASGGQLPNFLGVLGGAPSALRGFVRLRGELRDVSLPRPTLERIGLAVAAHHASEPDVTQHTRSARAAGLGIDEVTRARQWDSGDPAQAALLHWLRALVADHSVPDPLHEAVREYGWSDEQLLEAVAVVASESFAAMVDVAGDVPIDGS